MTPEDSTPKARGSHSPAENGRQLTLPLPPQPRFSFGNYIVHPGNELAFQAAQAVCRSPGTQYNPLYLHGEPGTGKTHLLEAMRACMEEVGARTTLLSGKMPPELPFFLEALRASPSAPGSLVLIDDLPELLGDIEGRRCFYEIVNLGIHCRLQVACAGGEAVQSMAELEDHLISRLRWGFIVRLEQPDDRSRERILKKLARDWQVDLPPQVASYLVARLPRDIASLSSGLAAVNSHALSRGTRISLPVAREALEIIADGESGP